MGARVRSLAVFFGVFSALPVALVFPFAGLLLWAWIAFMNPHREAFGIAYDFPFNFYIAIVTLGAWVLSAEPKRMPQGQSLPALFIAFGILMSITTYFALDYSVSYDRWDKHIRTLILVLVVMAMLTSKLRIQAFLWMIGLSIGYYAAKGGGYTLTGGSGRVLGPAQTLIADNNDFALALVVVIPILNYLRITSVNPIVKLACLMVMLMAVVAIIGTGSRGGFIGLAVLGIGFVTFTKPRLAAFLIPVAVALAVWAYAPSSWFERIKTIEQFETDASANQRFAAWETSFRVALDRPLLGAGFSGIESDKVDFRYNKVDWRSEESQQEKSRSRAAHSIYFQVLGDHGFLGFAVWLAIVGVAFVNVMQVIRMSRGVADLEWAGHLGRALVVTFVAYLVTGGLLSMAYYDVFLCLLALTAPLSVVVTNRVRSGVTEAEESLGLIPALHTAKGK